MIFSIHLYMAIYTGHLEPGRPLFEESHPVNGGFISSNNESLRFVSHLSVQTMSNYDPFIKSTDLCLLHPTSSYFFSNSMFEDTDRTETYGSLRSRSKSVGAWRHTPGRGLMEVSGLANISM